MGHKLKHHFDDEWSARLDPMVTNDLRMYAGEHCIVAFLEETPGVTSIEDLTPEQRLNLLSSFDLCRRLREFEKKEAGRAVNEDIQAGFPLGAGDVE